MVELLNLDFPYLLSENERDWDFLIDDDLVNPKTGNLESKEVLALVNQNILNPLQNKSAFLQELTLRKVSILLRQMRRLLIQAYPTRDFTTLNDFYASKNIIRHVDAKETIETVLRRDLLPSLEERLSQQFNFYYEILSVFLVLWQIGRSENLPTIYDEIPVRDVTGKTNLTLTIFSFKDFKSFVATYLTKYIEAKNKRSIKGDTYALSFLHTIIIEENFQIIYEPHKLIHIGNIRQVSATLEVLKKNRASFEGGELLRQYSDFLE